jgi:hypothetical protein
MAESLISPKIQSWKDCNLPVALSRPSSACPTDPAKRAADLMLNYHLAVTGEEQSALVSV